MNQRRRSRRQPTDREEQRQASSIEELIATAHTMVFGTGPYLVVDAAELRAAIFAAEDVPGSKIHFEDLPGTEEFEDLQSANIRASERSRGLP